MNLEYLKKIFVHLIDLFFYSSGVMIFGRSLGGAVAIYLASHPLYSQKLRAVMVENTFTSLPKIGKYLFNIPLVQYLPTFCFRNKVLLNFYNFFLY